MINAVDRVLVSRDIRGENELGAVCRGEEAMAEAILFKGEGKGCYSARDRWLRGNRGRVKLEWEARERGRS